MTGRPPIAEELDLAPHPEGGWYRETWRSSVAFEPAGYDGPRASATAIYFLLCPGEQSRWHVVRSDELWFWHSGGPLTLRFGGDGEAPDEARQQAQTLDQKSPQIRVPAGVWQAAAPAAGEAVLVSCVVSPGFDFADFRLA
jgi:predicted cupin superfamily sugar epimerase